MPACPYCGKEMEEGSVRARGSPGNMDLTFVDWVRDGDWHGTTVGSGFVVSIAAARCAECKTILFRY